jgi:hypothetical protein
MKPYEPKNRDKTKAKKKGGGGQRAIKNQIKKREKTMKRYVKKAKRGEFFLTKRQ